MASSKKQSAGQSVRYVGGADIREIDAQGWKNVGAEGQTKVVWDGKNDKTISASELSPEALSFVSESEEFEVAEDAPSEGDTDTGQGTPSS